MDDQVSRRRFLDWILGLGGLGMTCAVAYPLLRFVNPPARSSESGEWVDAGPQDQLQAGGHKDIMSSAGIPLMVINPGDGTIVALEKKCPHLGCMVEYDEGELICPCHGARFMLDGSLIDGPSPRGLKQFAVEIKATGHIFVGKELS